MVSTNLGNAIFRLFWNPRAQRALDGGAFGRKAVESRERSWREEAEGSVLLKAVTHWREDPGSWFAGSYDRLPELSLIHISEPTRPY